MSTKGGDESTSLWQEAKPKFAGIPAEARWDVEDTRTNPRLLNKEFVVPVFVELAELSGRSIADLITFFEKATDQYSVPDHVMDRLASEREIRSSDDPITFTLLSLPDAVERDFWRVLAVGQPQARTFRSGGFTRGKPLAVKKGPLSKTPVVGIIDDSIAFLNHRFRHTDGTTRFRHLWIMHADTLAGDPGEIDTPTILNGITLSTGNINNRIVKGRSEEALYREINNGVFGPAVRHSTSFHAGHGSHVLDLAAGADPGDPMADVPILGVQISPASIADTSGRELNPDLMQGLEWIITRALQMPGRFPLVINLSLGSLAGPLDGTSPVEKWIASEIKRYHHYSGHAPIRIVVAYGNAWRARLVAEAKLDPGETISIDWRILPDDATKSVLELRTRPGLGPTFGLRITPPDGGLPLDRPLIRGAPTVDQYVTPSGIAAEAADAFEPNFDKALVTVARTMRTDTQPTACSGNWKVTLINNGPKTASVTLKVQRDDTPGGYRRHGRQSWLDHPLAATYESVTRAYTLPAPGGPITRKGSEVSYAGIQHPSLYFVGAARPDPRAKDQSLAAHYAAEGAKPKPDAATVSALGDQGEALRGLRAAGNLSGSTARMSGSSMAAPQITRRLLELGMQAKLAAQPTPNTAHNPVEIADVLQKAPLVVADAQMGKGTVIA